MLNSPRRQRIINYHKQFKDRGAFTSKSDSKQSLNSLNTGNPQFSFNVDNRNDPFVNYSTQVQFQSEIEHRSMFTINPQQTRKKQYASVGGQISLKNRHFSRRKQLIDPSILLIPMVHDQSDRELKQKQEIQFDISSPGNIDKKLQYQKPLEKETKSIISMIKKDPIPSQKVENNQKRLKQIIKSQFVSFNNQKNKKLSSSKIKNNELDNDEKTLKRGSEINPTNLFYQTKKSFKNQTNSFQEFGHLLSPTNIGKLKSQINQFVLEKNKRKQRINEFDQSLIGQDYQEANRNLIFQNKKIKSNYFFNQPSIYYSEIEKNQQKTGHHSDLKSQNDRKYRNQSRTMAFSSPKTFSDQEKGKITISYKTSLAQLKGIYKNIQHRQNSGIQVLVPKILMEFYFDSNAQKIDLYKKARHIFDSLGIPAENISVKRYSNCIVIISKNICMMWESDGKIYLGGWQIKYLDEGVKHGLGLQWVPNEYVYYGEFVESKKSGFGIRKTKDDTFIGYWNKGKRTENGYMMSKNGGFFHPKVSINQETHLIDYQNMENDSFM